MKRTDGMLDLNACFDNKNYHELVTAGILKPLKNKIDNYKDDGKLSNFILFINGEMYYVKECAIWYAELIVNEFLKLIGIDCLDYDVATFDGEVYVLSKYYKKYDCEYISGDEILKDFYTDVDSQEYIDVINPSEQDRKRLEFYLNNLESIWLALDYRYKNHPDKEKIVYNLMMELKKRYFLKTFLLTDVDYHPGNWEIEEGEEIKLSPVYDNAACLENDIFGLPFGCTPESTEYGIFKHLDAFFGISASEEIEYLDGFLEGVKPSLFDEAIRRVEEKYGLTIPGKMNYSFRYKFNYNEIKSKIEKYRGNNGRKVS